MQYDPTGRSPSDPGAKLDAGKVPAGMLQGFSRALRAISQVFAAGARKGYCRGGWRSVPDGTTRYLDAAWRHRLASEKIDPETGLPHSFHEAWNILAVLELELEALEKEDSNANVYASGPLSGEDNDSCRSTGGGRTPPESSTCGNSGPGIRPDVSGSWDCPIIVLCNKYGKGYSAGGRCSCLDRGEKEGYNTSTYLDKRQAMLATDPPGDGTPRTRDKYVPALAHNSRRKYITVRIDREIWDNELERELTRVLAAAWTRARGEGNPGYQPSDDSPPL